MTAKKHKQRELSVQEQLKQWYIVVALLLLVVSVGLYVFHQPGATLGENFDYVRSSFFEALVSLITAIFSFSVWFRARSWVGLLILLGGAACLFLAFSEIMRGMGGN